MSDIENDGNAVAGRDEQGRYVKGTSGNPAGKPRGCLNRATRIAVQLLDGEAEALWRTELELAKGGDRALLKHCNDRILGSRRGQPVLFAMPPDVGAGDFAAAMGAILGAAARGMITPTEAESLARAAEAAARAVETGERVARERLAVAQEAFERRYALRVCALIFYGVRDIDEEVGALDYRLRDLCKPILLGGESALAALAAIPDTPDLIEADLAFMAAHPPRLGREASPLATGMAQTWQQLAQYLTENRMERLESSIAERTAAGEPAKLQFCTGMFEHLLGRFSCAPLAEEGNRAQHSGGGAT